VTRLPTEATIILEADQITTEVGTLFQKTSRTQSILKIRIHLDLLVELLTLDLHKRRRHSLHVGLGAAECHSATADGIFVFVSVNPSINNSAKQIIEDPRQNLSIEHSVQCSHEYCLLRIQLLPGVLDEVAVVQDPGNYLHFLASHSSARDFEIISSIALGALGEKTGNIFLMIEHDVDIALGW